MIRENHELPAQSRDSDSNLVRRIRRGVQNKNTDQYSKQIYHGYLLTPVSIAPDDRAVIGTF